MRKDYVKNPIPEEISEDGGASVMFVNKQTVPLDGSIEEALAGGYCMGQKTLIRNLFFGLMQSMADGVRRDGRPRTLANFLTVYPVVTGEFDLEKGFDPEVNGVKIRARLLNEMELDISTWSFNDVTPGKKGFTLQTVKAGEELGVYDVAQVGEINGKNLPNKGDGEPLSVHWEIEESEKSGVIAAADLTSNVSRIDIAAGAIAGITEDDDGKTIVLTVRGNFSTGKIAAKVKYVAPPGPEITKVTSGSGDEADVIYKAEAVYVHGERFAATQADTVTITKGDTDTWEWTGNNLTVVDPDGKLSLSYMSCKHNGETGTFFVGDDPCELTVSFKGSTRTVQYAGARV